MAESLLAIAARDADVRAANGVLTMQMGPNQVVAALSAEFEDSRTTPQIEACIGRIEQGRAPAAPRVGRAVRLAADAGGMARPAAGARAGGARGLQAAAQAVRGCIP